MITELLAFFKDQLPLFFASSIVVTFAIIGFGIREAYRVAKGNGFTVGVTKRSSHSGNVPFLGGIAVYLACLLSAASFLVIFKGIFDTTIIGRIFLGATILVFVGLYDDLNDIAPRKKLFYQVFVAMVTLVLLGIYDIHFFSLFGIDQLGENASFFFSTFLIVALINAFNFIDGIDGLCSGLALLAFLFFGILAYLKGDYTLLLLNGSLIGALGAAFYKNVYSVRKMFLGDSGSFLIGYVISVQVILVLSGYFENIDFMQKSAPVIIMALLSFPLVDSSRVIFLRITKGVSPFSADRNHIHHSLLNLGLTHQQATFLIMIYTVGITLLAIVLNNLEINVGYILFLITAFVLLSLPVLFARWKQDSSAVTRRSYSD